MNSKITVVFVCKCIFFVVKNLLKQKKSIYFNLAILLRYNSLPCGTECLLGWPQAIGQRPRKMDEIMMSKSNKYFKGFFDHWLHYLTILRVKI